MPRGLRVSFSGPRSLFAERASFALAGSNVELYSGEGASGGFLLEPGFGATGEVADGATLTISRIGGGFGTKRGGGPPMFFWDSRTGNALASPLGRDQGFAPNNFIPKTIDTAVRCNGRPTLRGDLNPTGALAFRTNEATAFALMTLTPFQSTELSHWTAFTRVRRDWDAEDIYQQYLLTGYNHPQSRGDWNVNNSYVVGDVVVHRGRVYNAVANLPAPSIEPPDNNVGSPTSWSLDTVRQWNIKDWRIWGQFSNGNNMHYSYGQTSSGTAGDPRFTVEFPQQGTRRPGGPGFGFSKNRWGTHYVHGRNSSGPGVNDAFFKVMANDTFIERTGFHSYSASRLQPWHRLASVQYQFVYTNGDVFHDWWDVFYVDDSACAVLLTDGDWGAIGTSYEICVPVSWSDGELAVNLRSGEWGSFSGKQLWVINDSGVRMKALEFL